MTDHRNEEDKLARVLALLDADTSCADLSTLAAQWIRERMKPRERTAMRNRHILNAWEGISEPERSRLAVLLDEAARAMTFCRVNRNRLPSEPVARELALARRYGALPATEQGMRKAIKGSAETKRIASIRFGLECVNKMRPSPMLERIR